jgi:hypothetical protein
MKSLSLMLLFAAQFYFQKSFAQNSETRENYNGIRSLGMGGADIAVVNDETALLVNPAALGKIRDLYGTVLDPEIEGSANFTDLYSKKAFTDLFRPDLMLPTLLASPDTRFHAKLQLFPSLVVKNFGIGIYAKRLLDARVDSTLTNMQTFYQDDLALVTGFNLKFFGGRVKIGASGKILSRIEIDKAIPVSGTLDIASNASEGVGLAGDVGIILAAPIAWLPTLSAVVRDVGGTKFSAASGVRLTATTRPTAQTQDFDLAAAIFPIHSNFARSSFTIEYKKMQTASSSIDKSRHVHAGYELNLRDSFFFRLGYNQRYWTTGFEMASENLQVQFAYYGEDVGVLGTPQEERRWAWKFAFRF